MQSFMHFIAGEKTALIAHNAAFDLRTGADSNFGKKLEENLRILMYSMFEKKHEKAILFLFESLKVFQFGSNAEK